MEHSSHPTAQSAKHDMLPPTFLRMPMVDSTAVLNRSNAAKDNITLATGMINPVAKGTGAPGVRAARLTSIMAPAQFAQKAALDTVKKCGSVAIGSRTIKASPSAPLLSTPATTTQLPFVRSAIAG